MLALANPYQLEQVMPGIGKLHGGFPAVPIDKNGLGILARLDAPERTGSPSSFGPLKITLQKLQFGVTEAKHFYKDLLDWVFLDVAQQF